MTERHSRTRRGTITIGSAGRAARTDAGRAAPGWPAIVLRVAGSGLLIATAAIHLDLYLTGPGQRVHHGRQLDQGSFQQLLQPLPLPGAVADQLQPAAGQVPARPGL